MDLGLSEEQELLKGTARQFLERECPKSLVRACEASELGFSGELWEKMAALGWLGLPYPEAYGGSGGSYLELAVLCEEMGRALLPSPFQATVVQSGLLILEAGSEEQKGWLLPQIGRGQLLLSLAYTEPSASYDPADLRVTAQARGKDFVISGTKLFVPHARSAQYLLYVARIAPDATGGHGLTVFLVPSHSPGLSLEPLATIAGEKQFGVTFQDVRVPADHVVGRVNEAWGSLRKVLQIATIMVCAEMVGGIRLAFEMSLEYSQQRVAFGRPIGAFQAIQHKLADMVEEVDSSWLATYEAAWRLSAGLPSAIAVSVAKAKVSEAFKKVTFEAHEIHAGVAFFYEHDLQLYTRRAKAWDHLFGDATYHRKLVAQGLGM